MTVLKTDAKEVNIITSGTNIQLHIQQGIEDAFIDLTPEQAMDIGQAISNQGSQAILLMQTIKKDSK